MTYKISLGRLRKKAYDSLARYKISLQSELAKYECLPEVIASHNKVINLLLYPKNKKYAKETNAYLLAMKNITGVSNLFLMNTKGTIIAESNWNKAPSAIGYQYGYRPYFKNAINGKLGRYYGVSIKAKRCAYYFAYPVTRKGKILGVVAIRLNQPCVEVPWSGDINHFLVTDMRGVIFLSTKPDWKFKTLRPLSQNTLKAIEQNKDYPISKVQPLPVVTMKNIKKNESIMQIKEGIKEGQLCEYLMIHNKMDEAGWTIRVLFHTSPVQTHVITSLIITGLLLCILITTTIYILERRRIIHEKLSGFEQMTASLHHELRQPLSAIEQFSSNTCTYLERNLIKEACDNVSIIRSEAKRMSKIIAQLEGVFTRKKSSILSPVHLPSTINEVIEILELRNKKVEIYQKISKEDLFVLANKTQIQQVFVNLISNAIDAMSGNKKSLLKIQCSCQKQKVKIYIHDNGPGILKANMLYIFDPFYTTKKEKGFGLGLSITKRIIQNFHGNIKALNHPEGGALFLITLLQAYQGE